MYSGFIPGSVFMDHSAMAQGTINSSTSCKSSAIYAVLSLHHLV